MDYRFFFEVPRGLDAAPPRGAARRAPIRWVEGLLGEDQDPVEASVPS